VRKSFVLFCLVTAWLSSAHAQPAPSNELERLKILVEAGAAPRAALDKAQAEIDDQRDDAILRRTLYGSLRVEEITEEQTAEMVAAAERRLERKLKRVDELKPLVEEGVMAPAALKPLTLELEERRQTLELALSRAKFLKEMAEMARAEEQIAESLSYESKPVRERFDGNGLFTTEHFKKVLLAFEKEFEKPLPVSANGDTAIHRALGFDHRGRVDIALNPDHPEGVWLRRFLEQARIPYYAFRAMVPGKATAPHIHIGPPSLRLQAAD
jgi:hypothetical protein